ncbi:hypothetical protein NX059_000024 [Plenodomus lindquistii]|nr:hypothetical protein NX059_000024 [Plenodomus lindquistii]
MATLIEHGNDARRHSALNVAHHLANAHTSHAPLMTAPMRGTPQGTALSASQNTAPVAEFRCLFTHDVRRKQKRWQDGFLKFHSFNSRVMVYDESRNFLGDTYYKDSNELHEGDQLSLDKGVMVEVAEAMGVTQTDLTALFEKKSKEPVLQPRAASLSKPFPRPSVVAPNTVQRNTSQLRHKSLNTLLGTPKGPIGKAQPMQSPFETRKEKEKENNLGLERAAKRHKTAHPPSPWRASSPAHEESPIANKVAPSLPRLPAPKAMRKAPAFIPPSALVIDVESEQDPCPSIFSDVSLPSPPPLKAKARKDTVPAKKPAPVPRPVVESVAAHEKPPVQDPKIPRGKVPVPSVKALETPKQLAPGSSPPVSASNRLANVESAILPLNLPFERPVSPAPPPRNPKAKSLRLSAGVKRGTLICQTLPPHTSSIRSAQRPSGAVQRIRQASHSVSREPSPAVSDSGPSRPRKSTAKSQKDAPRSKRKEADASTGVPVKRTKFSLLPRQASLDMSDDPELVHGMMDESLIVLPPPISPVNNNNDDTSPKPVQSKSPPAQHLTGKDEDTQDLVVVEDVSAGGIRAKAKLMEERLHKTKSTKKAAAKAKPVTSPPILEAPNSVCQDTSPAHTDASDNRSRTSSSSPKKLALSTGGFNKKPKRNSRLSPTTMAAPPIPSPPERRNETVALPPHPLRAASKGPLMSTTELAALLQTSTKPPKDTIEDSSSTTPGKSPNRNFRRVRSENDAPIPSAADDWEKRNLPKTSSTLTDITDPGAETVTLAPTIITAVEEPAKKPSQLATLIKRTDPQRRFKRTQSLVVQTNVQTVAAEVDPPSPVIDRDVGPWSTEAGDLFDWRPPGR